jgi:hypothetical protein
MLENPKKSITESLQILVTKLRNLKGSLTLSLQNNKFLHNKILTAYRGIPAYAIALVGPPPSISNLLSKLHSAIIVYKAKHSPETESFFTDQRYYSNQNRSYNNSRNRPHRYGSGSNRYNCNNRPNTRNLYFIYKKPNCRS